MEMAAEFIRPASSVGQTSRLSIPDIRSTKIVIDLHCHILPNIDDGSPSWSVSLNMCRQADIIEVIKKKEILTLNKSNYILLEFPHTQIPLHIEEILFQIQIMGITPIISHVERNLKFQQKPTLLSQLIQKGALAQITAASLCGSFGPIPKKIAQKFLSEELIYSIASDAHSDSEKGRGSFFSQALKEASKIIGHQAALNLVQSHPQKIIMNQ